MLFFSGGGHESEAVRLTDVDFAYTWSDPDANGIQTLFVNDSDTGKTWTAAAGAYSGSTEHASTVFDGKMWVAGGVNGSGYLQNVVSSTNGISFNIATTSAAFGARAESTLLTFTDPADGVQKMWMIGGKNGSGAMAQTVYKSQDGVTWTNAGANLPPIYGQASAVFSDPTDSNKVKMWVVGGRDVNNGVSNKVYKSVDGVTWEVATSAAAYGQRTDAVLLAYQNKLWLIGGRDQNFTDKRDVW
jgi:sucrose-6-phosphate hydrolase SacC (GH32 family)